MLSRFVFPCVGTGLLMVGTANATTMVSQPWDGVHAGYIAQVFPDVAPAGAFEFDDFSTAQACNLGILTAYGVENGDSTKNTAVTAQIWTGLPGSGSLLLTSISGSQVGSDLSIDFGGQLLPAGNYWLTAYVTREITTGGQWFWDATLPVTGSEEYLYDPTSVLAYSSSLLPGSASVHAPDALDMAFQLDATVVPEPATLGVLVMASTMALRRRRQTTEPAAMTA